MKKILLALSLFSFALVLLATLSTKALANDRRGDGDDRGHGDRSHNGLFNPEKQLSDSACDGKLGRPVIDVTQKVQNDADSGEAGNYWAFDYYNRHIKVWQIAAPTGEGGESTYCAIVTYDGNFYAVPGQIGPGNTPLGALINTPTDEPVNGKFSGGRRATIVGSLLASPLWATHGSVGTTNYQCDINGICPGFVAVFGTGSWADKYFVTGATNVDAWWGWKYNGGSHGTWINALSGNSGNIL
jgi:hypothetical protein